MVPTRLAQIRKERGLTQQEMATLLGITQPLFHLYESGERDIPTDIIAALKRHLKIRAVEIWIEVEKAPGGELVSVGAD